MKALLASALTALVLVTTAWASNVTPAQLSALSKRVTKLEKANARLSARLAADEAYNDRCVQAFQAVAFYTVTLHNADGTTTTFPTWSPPDAGEKPEFWVPTTTDSSCFVAP